VRTSLTWLLESAGLAAEAFGSAEAFLTSEAAKRPGCIVLDLRMPVMDGGTLFEQLLADRCTLPVIFLTGHGDVPTAVRFIKQGAFDFVEKPFAEGQILEKVRQALSRGVSLATRERERATLRARLGRLTDREREVFDRVRRGQANKVIAIELGISQKTVEIHRARMMRKLGAKNLPELIRFTDVLRED